MTSASKSSWRWPAAIVGMIALHATGMIVVILIATRDPSFAVEPDHYQKALSWDAFSARRRASQALGWHATARTDATPDGNHTRTLEMDIVDGDGRPVLGAQAAVLAFAHARGQERLRVDLVEGAPGRYTARAAIDRPGLWELRLVARRGQDTFTTTLLHAVGGPP